MAFFICLLFMLFVISAVINSGTSTVVRCRSLTCSHNKRGKCAKGTISVYDNMVRGLCYDHSDDMSKRILVPMIRKGMTFKHLESPPTKTPEVSVKNFKPWTSRKDKLDWWLN